MIILRSSEDQEKFLEERKKELGIINEDLLECRNSGRRRTESKKELLQFLASRMSVKPWWC
jgi:hypothetical protein